MNEAVVIAAYLMVIVFLALLVGWEYERSKRLPSGGSSFIDRSDRDLEKAGIAQHSHAER